MSGRGSGSAWPGEYQNNGGGRGSGGRGNRGGRGRGGRGGGRGRGGGGIASKFRAKIDRDGDIKMGDSSSGRGRGTGGRSTRGKKQQSKGPSKNIMKSKTKHNKRKETALKIKLAKGGMEVDREVTAAITTGKKKGKLPKGKKPRDIPVQLREAIIATMSQRWSPTECLLNLSQLFADPALAPLAHMAGNPNPWASFPCCSAILNVIQSHCSNVKMLNLSNNNIRSLQALQRLVDVAPQLVAVSLENNDIKTLSEINHIKKLPNLEKLWLVGNECLARFVDKRIEYERAVRKHFVKLTELDGSSFTSKQPLEKQQHFVPDELQGIVQGFILKYYACLDEAGRPNLGLAFTEKSVFSSTNLFFGNASRIPALYKAMNRNLKKTKEDQEVERLYYGSQIIRLLQQLPHTIHDLGDFAVDVWLGPPTTSSVLCVNISGTFKEMNPKGSSETRKYHRVLMLTPAVAGSPAAMAGWPATIVNEQLHLGPSGGQLQPGAPKSASRLLANATKEAIKTVVASSAPVGVPPNADALTQQFIMQTRLAPQFAQQCLQSNGWNLERAMADFQTLQASGKLPPEYLIS
eukprot:m.178024 g.178024  ORF g.178024 m.178024 type:complete len:577 (-) comp15464_c0_seq7:2058-3788(-)